MFVGRENELAMLKENYRSNGFKMVVVYGRRRVGKSYLLQHFFRNLDAKVVAFQAIANDVSLSIKTFRDALFEVYPLSTISIWIHGKNASNISLGNLARIRLSYVSMGSIETA